MTILSGFDSAFGPSLPVAQQMKAAGATFYGGYLGGPAAFHQWMPGEWQVLREVGLTPLPLWVPSMGLTESPVVAARQAVANANMVGLYGAIGLDTENGMRSVPTLVSWVDQFVATVNSLGRPCPVYNGAGYVPAGTPTFDVRWGSSVYPGPGEAAQYGPATAYGMSVDVDLADAGFPLGSFTPIPTPVSPPNPGGQVFVGMARTPSGKGYWLTDTTGDIFTHGDAGFFGSIPGNKVAVNNIVGIGAHPSGGGYWLVGSDGGVFAFGAVTFYGSLGGKPLNKPVCGIEVSPTGNGYGLIAQDGGVFCFGDYWYEGSGV